MKAYAVFDGGGVKGAALAGALKAAQDSNIEFVGYGGTSAGGIVALLATVGYSGHDLEKVMTTKLSLASVAKEIRQPLSSLDEIRKEFETPGFFTGLRLRKHRGLLQGLAANLGFYDGVTLMQEIFKLVRDKHEGLNQHFTFQDLANLGLPPLKIVASDLGRREPVVFSNAGDDESNGPVLDAVRASMSYPFAFRPVRSGSRLLVDGGLCSNLPVFLFDKERATDRLPLLAFDLVQKRDFDDGNYDLKKLCGSMLDTALEAGDFLMRRSSSDVYHIKITVPSDVHALDFDLDENRLAALFTKGSADTHEYIQRELAPWQQAGNEIEQLQARHAPQEDVEFLLGQFACQLERETKLTFVRTHVMLPTSYATRVVVYHFGMTNDADQDLELAEDAGCSGRCWTTRKSAYADLADAATGDNHVKWKMTRPQQAKVRRDRKTMVSIPIFAPGSEEQLIGVLSADSDAWVNPEGDSNEIEKILSLGQQWAIVLTHVLG